MEPISHVFVLSAGVQLRIFGLLFLSVLNVITCLLSDFES